VSAILEELRAMGGEEDGAGMARYGTNTDDVFGVSAYALRRTPHV